MTVFFDLSHFYGIGILTLIAYAIVMFALNRLGHLITPPRHLVTGASTDTEELNAMPVMLLALAFIATFLALMAALNLGVEGVTLRSMVIVAIFCLGALPLSASFVRGLADNVKQARLAYAHSEQFSEEYDRCIGERSSHWPEQYR